MLIFILLFLGVIILSFFLSKAFLGDHDGTNVSQKRDGVEDLKIEERFMDVGVGQHEKSIEDDDPFEGNPEAKVVIVEFADFECPYCGSFYRLVLPLLREKYIANGKVKLVYRDFPLPGHANARKFAEAAECADEQGSFWKMHNALFESQGRVNVESLKQYGMNMGLDLARFSECLDSGKYAAEIEDDRVDGTKLGVSATPTFFIHGKKLIGAQPFSAFEQMIEEELRV